jgi:hypothetical protein
MANNTENLVLEHLRAIRTEVGAVRETQIEHGHRLTRIELGQATVRRESSYDAEQAAEQSARMDRLSERVERVERRLEIQDGE